jgi:hypothetical protein
LVISFAFFLIYVLKIYPLQQENAAQFASPAAQQTTLLSSGAAGPASPEQR